MRTKLTAVAALAAAAVTLAAVAAAGPVAAKQRVAIQVKNGNGDVRPDPTDAGAIKPDTGTVNFCCWTQRSITRDGQAIDINNPQMTLTGKRGTLVARNQIGWSTSQTDGRSSPAPGKSSAAQATMPDSPEADA